MSYAKLSGTEKMMDQVFIIHVDMGNGEECSPDPTPFK